MHPRDTSTGSSFSEAGGAVLVRSDSESKILPADPNYNNNNSSDDDEPLSVEPLPIAMLAFGMTTFLLGSYSLRGVPFDSVIVAQGFAFGGAIQFAAGIVAYLQRNQVGGYLCTVFGIWWMCFTASQSILKYVAATVSFLNRQPQPLVGYDSGSLAAFNAVWLLFFLQALIVSLRTWRSNIFIPAAMVSVNITVVQLIALPFLDWRWLEICAGTTTTLSGLLGFYVGAALLINSVAQRPLVPLSIAGILCRSSKSKEAGQGSMEGTK